MKTLLVPLTLLVLLARLLLSGVFNTTASIADSSIPDEVASREAAHSDSAGAMITITWTTAPLPDE